MLTNIKNLIGIVLNPIGSVDVGLLILRISTGFLMFTYHGLSKITAGTERWEGLGHSLTNLIGIDSLHVFFGFLASLSESFGSVLIALGFFTRISSFFLLFTMTIATLKKVFLGGSFELALVYGIICLALIISGSGRYSLDYYFFRKRERGF
tara:strand:- start:96 stop:551 length:456 start_codon:yes stop_codon:yes gene_type:complete